MAFENGAGVVPVMDLNRGGYGYNDAYGGGMWMWIIILFALMGGNGFGWGNNRGLEGALTRSDLTNGFDAQDIKNGIRGVQNGLCDGFYAQNTTMLQGFNGLGRDVLENRFALGSAIAENRFAAQQCCCETNRNIDAVRYENAQNTCAITNNATANTQKILDKLCLMESNAKDMQIADLREKLAVANLQVSQQVQNATLVNTLRPFPQPAYVTCLPYESARGFHNYNGGCGCGC